MESRALRTGLLPGSGRHRKPEAEVQINLKMRKKQERGEWKCSLWGLILLNVSALQFQTSQKFQCSPHLVWIFMCHYIMVDKPKGLLTRSVKKKTLFQLLCEI